MTTASTDATHNDNTRPAGGTVAGSDPDPALSQGVAFLEPGPDAAHGPAHGGDDPGDVRGDAPHPDFVDPLIAAAHSWKVGDVGQRRRKVAALIDDGAMMLHPAFLGWLGYVLNWDDVVKQLPVLKKNGTWHHKGGKKRMRGYTVYYLDLLMPTMVLLQQVLNYRLGIGRTLPTHPTADRPVSMAQGMTDVDGRELVTLLHTYYSDEGLQRTLAGAHKKLKAYRSGKNAWEPLRDLIYSDGVEDGGLWMQTVYAPIGDDGSINFDAAQASLAPADAASRKAVCDDRLDPDGLLAALPLLAPLRKDVLPAADGDPARRVAPMTVKESVGARIGQLKARLSTSGAAYLDELDDDLRELLATMVMPVSLVYAVEDGTGEPADMGAVSLFREIQEHFHGLDHLGHPENEAERLVADKARDALYEAVDEGLFVVADPDTGENGWGQTVTVPWTRELLDVLSGRGDFSALAALGLPANRMGAGVAAATLVYGNGPERAIIGRALGSRSNGGSFDNMLLGRRAALLREMTFPDLESGVNRRVFEPLDGKALFEASPVGWDADVAALVTKVSVPGHTAVERALFDIVVVVAGVEDGLQMVDLGSSGVARGFFRTKAHNALAGTEVLVDPQSGVKRLAKVPAGEQYVRALLEGNLLRAEPTPATVDGVVLDCPTTAQWDEWSQGVGLLEDDGSPVMQTKPAAVVDEHGRLVSVDGVVKTMVVSVPTPVDKTVFDQFSAHQMTKRAKAAYENDGGGMPVTRTLTSAEKVDDALDRFASSLAHVHSLTADLEALGDAGHVLTDEQRRRIEALARDLRNMVSLANVRAVGARLDLVMAQSDMLHAQLVAVDAELADDPDGGEVEPGAGVGDRG